MFPFLHNIIACFSKDRWDSLTTDRAGRYGEIKCQNIFDKIPQYWYYDNIVLTIVENNGTAKPVW